MNTYIPMDLTVRVIKNRTNDAPHYSAHLFIGNPSLPSEPESEEVYRGSASGKSVFACVTALQEMVLSWMETNSVSYVRGLTDNASCPLTIESNTQEIKITPTTYNDMSTETQNTYRNGTARITVWREPEGLFAIITREASGNPLLLPPSDEKVTFTAVTTAGPEDEKMLRLMTVSELKRPATTISITWLETREVWEF